MWNNKKVSIVFPAYNEGENIRNAIEDFFSSIYVDEIIVVNNNSTDNTIELVMKTNAKLIHEKKQGYGYAIQRGLKDASGEYIIVAEPDGTFIGRDILKLLAYSCDVDLVLGTRTSKELIWYGANMGLFLKWGNWALAKMIELLFNGPSLTDVGCTMRLIKKNALEKIQSQFTVGGSHFSPEMIILAIMNGLDVIEIPLNYKKRVGTSKITGEKTKAFKLGLVMIKLILKYWIKNLFAKKI